MASVLASSLQQELNTFLQSNDKVTMQDTNRVRTAMGELAALQQAMAKLQARFASESSLGLRTDELFRCVSRQLRIRMPAKPQSCEAMRHPNSQAFPVNACCKAAATSLGAHGVLGVKIEATAAAVSCLHGLASQGTSNCCWRLVDDPTPPHPIRPYSLRALRLGA